MAKPEVLAMVWGICKEMLIKYCVLLNIIFSPARLEAVSLVVAIIVYLVMFTTELKYCWI